MKIDMHHPEERQAIRDEAFVHAEQDFLNMQDLLEELGKTQRPARIEVFEEEEEEQEIEGEYFERYL